METTTPENKQTKQRTYKPGRYYKNQVQLTSIYCSCWFLFCMNSSMLNNLVVYILHSLFVSGNLDMCVSVDVVRVDGRGSRKL